MRSQHFIVTSEASSKGMFKMTNMHSKLLNCFLSNTNKTMLVFRSFLFPVLNKLVELFISVVSPNVEEMDGHKWHHFP